VQQLLRGEKGEGCQPPTADTHRAHQHQPTVLDTRLPFQSTMSCQFHSSFFLFCRLAGGMKRRRGAVETWSGRVLSFLEICFFHLTFPPYFSAQTCPATKGVCITRASAPSDGLLFSDLPYHIRLCCCIYGVSPGRLLNSWAGRWAALKFGEMGVALSLLGFGWGGMGQVGLYG